MYFNQQRTHTIAMVYEDMLTNKEEKTHSNILE